MEKKLLICILSVLAFVGICFLPPFSLKILVAGILLSIATMLLAIIVKNILGKYIFIIMFSLVFPFSLLEAYSHILLKINARDPNSIIEYKVLDGKKSHVPHERIGYTLVPNNSYTDQTWNNGKLACEYNVTTNAQGRRVTPEHPQAKYAVLLFGCSFTFGAGINDEETAAWKLGEILGSEYQIFNFGHAGYGTHNILATIETALPDLQKYQHIYTYFLTIDDHQRRVVGLANWSTHAPRYEIENSKAVYKGNYKEKIPYPWEKEGLTWLQQSAILTFYKTPLNKLFLPYVAKENPLKLVAALLSTSSEFIQKLYPQNSSTILVWPEAGPSKIITPLIPLVKDIPIVDIEAWLPNFKIDTWKYRILKDGHPNALANTLVAQGIAKLILGQNKQAKP